MDIKTSTQLFPSERKENKKENKRKLEADLEQASIQPSVKYNLKIPITNKTLMSFNLSLSSLLCLQALRMVSKPSYGWTRSNMPLNVKDNSAVNPNILSFPIL